MSDSHAHASSVAPPNTHGHHDDAAHVQAHVNTYLKIGGLLVLFTVITVWLSYFDFGVIFGAPPGDKKWNIIVALIVATFKVSLVAAYFMHLKEEKATIWRFLIVTVFFVSGLFFLTLLHEKDPIQGTNYSQHDN